MHQTELQKLRDSLWVLCACISSASPDGFTARELLQAYVHRKTVRRSKPAPCTQLDDIYSIGFFQMAHLASQRSASKPRDYVFATMPQFPWYHYPITAESMTFSDIFVDLHGQATRSRHAFASRITASMTDPNATDSQHAWLPSSDQPEPECLGDFLKLLGGSLAEETPTGVPNEHVTTSGLVCEVQGLSPEGCLQMLQSAMQFSERAWGECHHSGELSKSGSRPDVEWEIRINDAAHWGFVPDTLKSKGSHMLAIEDENETTLIKGLSIQYQECDSSISEILDSSNLGDSEPAYVPVLDQARRVLDNMWCASEGFPGEDFQRHDWALFTKLMRGRWPTPLLHTMALLAAMVGCGIGLSAARWVHKHFVPALIRFDATTAVLGLLARHARSAAPSDVRTMFSVGRHLSGPWLGRDLVLADPERSMVPVGIIPDVQKADSSATEADEMYQKRMGILYKGLVRSNSEKGIEFVHLSLGSILAVWKSKKAMRYKQSADTP